MIRYEVRRGSAVVTTRDDAKAALLFAEAHSFSPNGELKVYAVERREWEITEAPAEPIPLKPSRGREEQARRRA